MMLRDIKWENFKRVTVNAVGYKSDMNTPEVKGKYVYPMEKIIGDDDGKGFAIHIKAPTQSYRSSIYTLYFNIGSLWISPKMYIDGYTELDDLKNVIKNSTEICTIDGYKKCIENRLKNERAWVSKAELLPLVEFGEDELIKRCHEHREAITKRREEERAENAERARKYEEEQNEKIRRAWEETKADVLANMKAGKRIRNEELYGENVLVKLIEECGIKIPLRTKGWMMDVCRFVGCTFNQDGTVTAYYDKRRGKCSQKVFDILYEFWKYNNEGGKQV